MSRTLRITMKDELAERIERCRKEVGAKMIARGEREPTLDEVLDHLIMDGIVASESKRGDIVGDGRKVGDLTLRELLQATGIEDAAAARRAAVESREHHEKVRDAVHEILCDTNRLHVVAPTRVRTQENLTTLVEFMKSGLGPGRALAVCFAVVEDNEPHATTKSTSGVN